MARPAALGPMQAEAARKMRHTAGLLDHDHPETIAGDHVRDAARLTETGRHEGAQRHLDAAMQLMTPQNLHRHGIRDDEGHASAKHHMHQIHRHLLHVQDIADAKSRNDEIRTALRAVRGQISATDAAAAAGPPLPGHAPPKQPVQLATPGRQYRYRHGWIKLLNALGAGSATEAAARGAGMPLEMPGRKRPARPRLAPVTKTPTVPAGWSRAEDSAHLNGKQVVATNARGGTFIGTYQHPGKVVPRHSGAIRAKYVREATIQDSAVFNREQARQRASRPGLPRQLIGHGYSFTRPPGRVIDLKASTAWMNERRNPATGEWMTGGTRGQQAYGVKGAPLGRKISWNEAIGGLDVFSKMEGYVPPEQRHKVPGFVGTEGSVFGKKLSAKEAFGAMQALGEGTAKERAVRRGEIAATFRSRLSSKAQRKIYDKLLKRGRHPSGAYLIASKFQPGMLESAVLANSGLGGLLMASAHGHHVAGTPYTYKHGWRKLTGEPEPQSFGAGTMAGSFEHINAIEDLAARAAAGSGDPGRRSPVMGNALMNVARAVGGRDMRRARVHLAMARWANQHEANGYYTRDLRELARQLELVPKGTTGWEGKIKNPLTPAGQHSGKFVASQRARPPGHPTAGARRTQYQAYSNVDLSARTAMLERTPAPLGRPGGPGLYHVKGMGHTAYFQQVVKALIEKRGMPKDKAYRIAWGALRKWRRGGGHVHPEVRAAATGALAGEAAKGAIAHSHAIGPWEIADGLIELATREPYHREPDETVECPYCGKWDSPDAIFCDQCGRRLPDSAFGTSNTGQAAIELFNPYHAPTGQFTTASGAGAGQQPAGQQVPPKQKRAQLLKRAASLRSQIRGLEAQLHSLTSRPKSRSSTPAKRGAAATSAKQARQSQQQAAQAAKTAKTATRKTAKPQMSPATIRAKIIALRAQLAATLAQIKKL